MRLIIIVIASLMVVSCELVYYPLGAVVYVPEVIGKKIEENKSEKEFYRNMADINLCKAEMNTRDKSRLKKILKEVKKRELNCEAVVVAEERRIAAAEAKKKAEQEKETARVKNLEDIDLCDEGLSSDGEWNPNGVVYVEAGERELSHLDCQHLTGRYSREFKEKARVKLLEDMDLCDEALTSDGEWAVSFLDSDTYNTIEEYKEKLEKHKKESPISIEVSNRELTQLTCQQLTGKYTPEMIAKFVKIDICHEYGFTDGTPDMNMCLIQLETQEKTDQLIAATKAAEAASKDAAAASRDAETAARRAEAKQKEILERVKKAEKSASRAAYSAGVLSADYYHKKSMCIAGAGSDWVNC